MNLRRANTNFIQIRDLVPHAEPMILVDEVVYSDDNGAECSITVGSGLSPRLSKTTVPVWVAIEYMAQTIAVSAGVNQDRKKSKEIGFLMGARKATFGQKHFELGSQVHARVTRVYDDGKMAQFQGEVFDPETSYKYAEAVLSVFRPGDAINGV